ncbi:DUF4913 domain-containing protein [Paenarthrobacter histidinolovorans]|uniref:DUF4913 domain-containing protein n=1 Tax=Paenarthrobacter histidinolovorans TaxID=43664 RepID=A0ABW8MZI2_9MICC
MTEPVDAWAETSNPPPVEAQPLVNEPDPETTSEDTASADSEVTADGPQGNDVEAPRLNTGAGQSEADGMDFYVTASEAAAMVTERLRLRRKTTPAMFRRMVIDNEAPAPAVDDGKTVKWSQIALDVWLDDLSAADEEGDETDDGAPGAAEVAPDGKDFYLSAGEAAALLSEATDGKKISVTRFRRMVLAGEAPAPTVQAGGTAKWSQTSLDAWITDALDSADAGSGSGPLDGDATGFMLGLEDVLALVAAKAEAVTASTWRSLVMEGKAPGPVVWEPPTWSIEAVEAWVEKSLESGVLKPKSEAQLVYGSTAMWVEQYLVPTYRRQLSGNGEKGTWCPKWWKHGEAIIRLEALWRAWEHLRLDGSTGMSVWLKDHLDHHLPMLIDSDGPFRGCTTANGHAEQPHGLQMFALDAPPPAFFPDVREPKKDNPEGKS